MVYKENEFVNRPLTVAPTLEVADPTGDVVKTRAALARTFAADGIEALLAEHSETVHVLEKPA